MMIRMKIKEKKKTKKKKVGTLSRWRLRVRGCALEKKGTTFSPPLINQAEGRRRAIIAIVHEARSPDRNDQGTACACAYPRVAPAILIRVCVSCGPYSDQGYVSVTSLQMQGRNERNTGINPAYRVPFLSLSSSALFPSPFIPFSVSPFLPLLSLSLSLDELVRVFFFSFFFDQKPTRYAQIDPRLISV